MELENKYKELLGERDKFKHENIALRNGLKDTEHARDILDNTYVDADDIANQLDQMKRRNESLKRENELIRRELASLKTANLKCRDFIILVDGGENDVLDALHGQIENLRKKNTQLEEEVERARKSTQGNKFLQTELEEARKEIDLLKRGGGSANNLNSSMGDGKAHTMIREYLERIESLQEENDNLRSR